MASTTSWAWYSSGPWPGFTSQNQNNLGSNGNGRSVDPNGLKTITWNDANDDGKINDNDRGDGTAANGDSVTVNGTTKVVKEIANYNNSTMVHDGVTYNVPLAVWLFEDGTYMVRLADANIPPGSYADVTSLRLGSWDGVEYGASTVATRDDGFVCFAAGTRIETATGLRAVERIAVGTLVPTLDDGLQPVRWIGSARVSGMACMAPVRMAPGVFGNPRPLRISPQHRVLLRGWRAELYFGEPEVLVPAIHLENGETIRRVPCPAVTYVHLMFDRHQLICAEGVISESLQVGPMALGQIGTAARLELLQLFPDLAHRTVDATARPCLRAHEARLFALASGVLP